MHDLAAVLGTTVARMVREMSWGEFHGWMAFFDDRPRSFDGDFRAAAIMMSNGAKRKEAMAMFPSLSEPMPRFKEQHKQIIVDGVDPALASGLAKLMRHAEAE